MRDYDYPSTDTHMPEYIGEPKPERKTILTELDDIVTAFMPLAFLIAATLAGGMLVFKPNLKDSDLLKTFVSTTLGAAAMATRHKTKSNY